MHTPPVTGDSHKHFTPSGLVFIYNGISIYNYPQPEWVCCCQKFLLNKMSISVPNPPGISEGTLPAHLAGFGEENSGVPLWYWWASEELLNQTQRSRKLRNSGQGKKRCDFYVIFRVLDNQYNFEKHLRSLLETRCSKESVLLMPVSHVGLWSRYRWRRRGVMAKGEAAIFP